MKQIKELLIILRDYINSPDIHLYSFNGMCQCVRHLTMLNKLNVTECLRLLHYIEDNAPLHTIHYPYWFKIGNIKPRIKWLNKHINL